MVCVLREYRYRKITNKWHEPTPGVCLIEVSRLRESLVYVSFQKYSGRKATLATMEKHTDTSLLPLSFPEKYMQSVCPLIHDNLSQIWWTLVVRAAFQEIITEKF